MGNKKLVTFALIVGVISSLVIAFGAGYSSGYARYSSDDGMLDGVVDAWYLITEEYVEPQQVDTGLLAEAAIRGMVEYLDDPYTYYLDEEDLLKLQESLEGKYEGIGVLVAFAEEGITIVRVFDDSPAQAAGLKKGEIILEVDGVALGADTQNELTLKIKGPAGTAVELLLLNPQTQQTRSVNVIRAEIISISVYYEIIRDIVYIEISEFTEQTDKELEAVFEDIEGLSHSGIVLDLRGNPGGRLSAVVEVASRFVTEGTVISIVYNDGSSHDYEVVNQEYTTDLPLLVLVDEYSASGSEVLCGFFQDYGRATIIGEVTFGKGSVNNLYELSSSGGLYLTIARWYTPSGYLIEGQGITPDISTELEGEELLGWALDYVNSNY